MAKYKVVLIDGKKDNPVYVDLKGRESVRRLFQNHGFWYNGIFYAASVIHSIVPVPVEEE